VSGVIDNCGFAGGNDPDHEDGQALMDSNEHVDVRSAEPAHYLQPLRLRQEVCLAIATVDWGANDLGTMNASVGDNDAVKERREEHMSKPYLWGPVCDNRYYCRCSKMRSLIRPSTVSSTQTKLHRRLWPRSLWAVL
jgi:hypothetical protein